MAKSRDYIYMDVLDLKGRKLGYVNDLIVDFGRKTVIGFKMNSFKLKKAQREVLKESIVYHHSDIIAGSTCEVSGLEFSSILNMHVVDINFNVIGLVSEVLFDGKTFEIKGLMVKKSSFLDMFTPRKILLLKDLIIGEKYILYMSRCRNIEMECIPSVGMGLPAKMEVYYEKD